MVKGGSGKWRGDGRMGVRELGEGEGGEGRIEERGGGE